MKKLILCVAIMVLATSAYAYNKPTLRPNTQWGQPDYQQKGLVVEEQYDGSKVVREETQPGSRIGNRFEKGVVIEDNGDGSYTGRREFLPGSGTQDIFDPGFTIEAE